MFLESSFGILGRHRSVIEEVLLDRIGERSAVFGVGHQLLMQVLRIKVLRLRSCGKRPVPIFANIKQGMLCVVLEISEALTSNATAYRKEVVDCFIAQKC